MLPLTELVPTVVPPVVQMVGAVGWGPKTVKVTVPPALEPEVEPRTAEMEEAAMVVPSTPVEGSLVVSEGEALPTIISAMPEPHVLDAALLPAVTAVRGVPPVVADGRRRVAGRRVSRCRSR